MKPIAAFFLVLILALAGCAPDPSVPMKGTEPPATTVPAPAAPQEAPPSVTSPAAPTGDYGRASQGFVRTPLTDESGADLLYTGGEIRIPYRLDASGPAYADGAGLLLFLNGVPQPFRTGERDTTEYLQVFQGDENGRILVQTELIFTPVTGRKGDTLELYAMGIVAPNCRPSDRASFAYGFGSQSTGISLRFESDPPAQELPERAGHLADITARYTPVTPVDTTCRELQNQDFYFDFTANEAPGHGWLHGIAVGAPIHLRQWVYGNEDARFGIIILVDNRPVAPEDGSGILVEIRADEKAVVEAELYLSEFDGEAAVYAVLVPLDPDAVCFLQASSPIYLSGE